MKNPIEKIGLFATPDSIEDLQAYVGQFCEGEAVVANVIMGMTWNLASKIVDETDNPVETVLNAMVQAYLDRSDPDGGWDECIVQARIHMHDMKYGDICEWVKFIEDGISVNYCANSDWFWLGEE